MYEKNYAIDYAFKNIMEFLLEILPYDLIAR